MTKAFSYLRTSGDDGKEKAAIIPSGLETGWMDC
jgi:hypothetical protein